MRKEEKQMIVFNQMFSFTLQNVLIYIQQVCVWYLPHAISEICAGEEKVIGANTVTDLMVQTQQPGMEATLTGQPHKHMWSYNFKTEKWDEVLVMVVSEITLRRLTWLGVRAVFLRKPYQTDI